MITIHSNNFKHYFQTNTFSQDHYDLFIENLAIHKCSCTCGQKGNLIHHGYYKRSLKLEIAVLILKILRLKCKACGKTHAILPEFIVPYSQIILSDHISIIQRFLNNKSTLPIIESNPNLEEANVKHIIKQFIKHWQEKMNSFKIAFDDYLTQTCFHLFNRQFMQIKRTANILFL